MKYTLIFSLLVSMGVVKHFNPNETLKEDIRSKVHFESSYSKAFEEAKLKHKQLIIKLTAEHCRYCKKMDKEVFEDKDVVEKVNKNFVVLELDVNKDKLPLGITKTMTPTFFFVNEEAKIVRKIPGSWNKVDFLDLLQSSLKS